jgi:hypothetical protein
VHIDHLYDNDDEPWPIEIEDHDGNLHAVNLEPGQVQYKFLGTLLILMQLLFLFVFFFITTRTNLYHLLF